jgi:Apea-like HEPN
MSALSRRDAIVVEKGSSNSTVNLVGTFLDFAEKLLARARSFVEAEGMPKRVERPFLFRAPEFSGPAASGSTISFSGVEKPDFRGLLLFNRERWAKAEAERCAHEHFAHDVRRDRQVLDENWQPIVSPAFGHLGNQLGSQLTYEAFYAIADLCERRQTLRLTRQQLIEAYERLKEEWSCPTVMWRLQAPLLNFKTEKCPVRIGQSLELAPLRHDEKTSLWNQNAGFGPFGEPQVMDPGDLARAHFVFRGASTTGRDDPGFGPEFRDEVSRVVAALRLFGSGDVGIPAILGTSNGLFEKVSSQHVFDGRARNSGRIYELRAAVWNDFTKVYDALGGADEKMSIPLRRFNQAYGRQSGEDTIIDLTIALESCLLPNTREELQYRLSMRGAALLASLRNPLETQALLKILYEIRSEIVHNGRLLSENGVRGRIERLGPVVAKDFLHACEDVVRDVLRESILRLATGGTLRALSEELDAKVLSGLLPLP